ncbi:MAG TPA: hypothetical protein VN088_10230, partial [Nocardioides sp.]|nr:hypothetical protein [Nocardioides sp.]
MSTLRIVGGRDASGRPTSVAFRDGRVVADVPSDHLDTETYDAAGAYVVPGLIDLQVNGAAGGDLTDEPERLWDVAAALAGFGVTAFVPTVITSEADNRERALAALRSGPPDGWQGATPLGLHFEGPMLAAARKGAHPEHRLVAPSAELVAGWSREAGVLMATIAPELPGALEVIATLAQRGVIVSIGHTEASTAQTLAA